MSLNKGICGVFLSVLLCVSQLVVPSAWALSAKISGVDTAPGLSDEGRIQDLSRLPYALIRALYDLEKDHTVLPETVALETMKEKPQRIMLTRKSATSATYYEYMLSLFDTQTQGWVEQKKAKIVISEHANYVNVSNLYLNQEFDDLSVSQEGVGTAILVYVARYAQLKKKALILGTQNYGLFEMLHEKISQKMLCKCEALEYDYGSYDAFPIRHFLSTWTADGGGVTIMMTTPTVILKNVFIDWGAEKRVKSPDSAHWVSIEGQSDGRIAVAVAEEKKGPYTVVKPYIAMPFLVNIWIKPEDIFSGVSTWDMVLTLAKKIAEAEKPASAAARSRVMRTEPDVITQAIGVCRSA